MSFQRIERDVPYVYFVVNDFHYRTDGKSTQGQDGDTWNTTYSIPIILEARKAFARDRKNKARRERDQIRRYCGLVRVRGALGGIYWE